MLPSPEIYPIHIAARDGNHKLLRLLLRAGADPQQKTSKGATAKLSGRVSVVVLKRCINGDMFPTKESTKGWIFEQNSGWWFDIF